MMLPDLQSFLTIHLFAFLLIFSRIGTAFITLPGIGESFVSPRIRLLLALLMSAVMLPILLPILPLMPQDTAHLFALIAGEVCYGAFLGLMARTLIITLEGAGMLIAMQTLLSNATIFNPAMATQSSLPSALLSMLGVTLLFSTDLHHLLLLSLADSYTVFNPAATPPLGDMTKAYGTLISESFVVSVQLAAPFIILGLAFYLGLGLLARLMPQLQIFFIAIPAQIYFGLLLLATMLSTIMMLWLNYAQSTLQHFLGG